MSYNPIQQDGAIALSNAITNNKKLKILSLYDLLTLIDKKSAMIIIRSLINNNTVIKLDLSIALCENGISVVTAEAEKVNSKRKLHNEHIIDFDLYYYDLQNYSYLGNYTTEDNLSVVHATNYN